MKSANPLPIWSFNAALTSICVMLSSAGNTEFWTSLFTAISTTRVVFLVSSVEISLRIFSCRATSSACSFVRASSKR
jgi:hypothetical protein